jgi:hypothetical protein
VAKYLETRDDPNRKTLEDIAKFNVEHADLELPKCYSTRHPSLSTKSRLTRQTDYPNQNSIVEIINHNFTPADYEAAKATLKKEALENGVGKVMEEHKPDAIIGPTDGRLASIAAAIGKFSR